VKQTALFRLAPNKDLPSRLVLRRDLALSITGTTVVDEFPIIDRVFKLGLPVPQPILVEADRALLDGAFMIMVEIESATPAGTYFAEERKLQPRLMGPSFGKEVAALLAQLHRGTAHASGTAVDFNEQLKQHYNDWCAIDSPPLSLTMDLSYAWLLSHPLPPDRPQALVHGDIGSHNMMVRDGHLVSLLDWELAHEGDPAEDLAQCRMMLLPDTMPWPDFKREYLAAGGDPLACDDRAVAYYCIWTYLKHGLMNSTLRNVYLRGERDDMVAAIVAGHYYVRLMQYQARALQIAVDTQKAN
jgi:aminoglycoside phosphotransferase (APT) family kinase protein